MRDYLKNNYKVFFTLYSTMFMLSCLNVNYQDKPQIYLWDFKDCINCAPTEVFIENNQLYSLDKGILFSRLLKKNELDTLTRIISKINLDKIDSTYYKNLPHYDYASDFSITTKKIGFSTSVYDSVFPSEIYKIRNYILKITNRKGLEKFDKGQLEKIGNIWVHRLVNSRRDTLLPSHESIFKIQKTLKTTNAKDWFESNSIGNVQYKLLFEDFGDVKSDIESLYITNDNKIFFKIENQEKYFFTNFKYQIQDYPRYNPSLQ